jgi:putative transposase
MIDRQHDLSITRQAELLAISRDPVYYLPRSVSEADLALMRRIDQLHLEHPFMGARMLPITHSNQVWVLDTTYVPMVWGFVYLTAVVDVFSRRVLAHRVAITLEAIHAEEVIEQALQKYGAPQIVNADQGSQFLKVYDSVSAARADIADYLAWYNARRAHSSLDRLTPDEAHFAGLPQLKRAA